MIFIGFKIPVEMFQNTNRKVYNNDYVYKVSDVDKKFEGGIYQGLFLLPFVKDTLHLNGVPKF